MRRNIFAAISILSILFSCSLMAQDARQRTVTTVVQDALAQLPAATSADLYREMGDLAGSAPASVEILAGMLVSASEGQNSKVEYAINGLVNYVSDQANARYAAAVRQGLAAAAGKCQDVPCKVFLLQQLRLLATSEDIPVFMEYVADPELGSVAMGAIIGIEGSEDAILELIKNGGASRPLLAYAAAEKGLEAAEPYILSWIKENGGNALEDTDPSSKADTPDLRSYYHALSCCGTEASLKVLQKNSVYDYMTLLSRIASQGDTRTALSGARKMLRSQEPAIRCAALEIVLGLQGMDAVKVLLSELERGDRECRCAALRYAEAFAGEPLYSAVAGVYGSLDAEARADVLEWFGEMGAVSQSALVAEAFGDPDDAVVIAAIGAAGKIGGDLAADALIEELGASPVFASAAVNALLSFRDDISGKISEALSGDAQTVRNALSIVTARRMKSLAPAVFELMSEGDKDVEDAAYRALSGVAGASDSGKINSFFTPDQTPERTVLLQNAMCSALEDLSPEQQFETVKGFISEGCDPVLYYPVLAQAGECKDAVAMLAQGYWDGPDSDAAFRALMSVDSFNAADILYSVAEKDPSRASEALGRFVYLTGVSGLDAKSKVFRYSSVMALDPDVKVKRQVLQSLSSTPVMSAFILASQYLDDSQTAYAAAGAVKSIASKTEDEIDYTLLKTSLEKAMSAYAAAGGADDGYAVDEIRKMLAGLQPPAEKFVLPEDEAKAGFEVLFDGTDLSKWTGNTVDYTPVNGTIYVSANYGGGGNLYTRKEYRDFVFRFEFCFVKPGVNNGVGIRTPMGKDAAYWGMCEVQILDHDDPIYKDLNEYQVHGSAYGIIPAKRVVHKPLGEWNTEEIKVVGDRVTVTLNGEVILDGNLRKACKGHNVAPDGGTVNPYTVDHRNHPGMFNEKGHIGFLGHGEGIKFRNVRILDLSK